MIVLERRIENSKGFTPDLYLPLTAEERSIVRGIRETSCRKKILLQLPRDYVLCPGDQICDLRETIRVEIVAATECLIRVRANSIIELIEAAYHLGNRHVALELHANELFLQEDSVLVSMLTNRGLIVNKCRRYFYPERGAYSHKSKH